MCVCGVPCLGVSCYPGLGVVPTYALRSSAGSFGICRLPSSASGAKAPLRWVRAIGMAANGTKEEAEPVVAGAAQSCQHQKACCLRNLW